MSTSIHSGRTQGAQRRSETDQPMQLVTGDVHPPIIGNHWVSHRAACRIGPRWLNGAAPTDANLPPSTNRRLPRLKSAPAVDYSRFRSRSDRSINGKYGRPGTLSPPQRQCIENSFKADGDVRCRCGDLKKLRGPRTDRKLLAWSCRVAIVLVLPALVAMVATRAVLGGEFDKILPENPPFSETPVPFCQFSRTRAFKSFRSTNLTLELN